MIVVVHNKDAQLKLVALRKLADELIADLGDQVVLKALETYGKPGVRVAKPGELPLGIKAAIGK